MAAKPAARDLPSVGLGQGGYVRGTPTQYGAIGDPFDALLSLGAETYKERVSTLRQEIQKLEANGRVGRKVFSKAAKDFIVPTGA